MSRSHLPTRAITVALVPSLLAGGLILACGGGKGRNQAKGGPAASHGAPVQALQGVWEGHMRVGGRNEKAVAVAVGGEQGGLDLILSAQAQDPHDHHYFIKVGADRACVAKKVVEGEGARAVECVLDGLEPGTRLAGEIKTEGAFELRRAVHAFRRPFTLEALAGDWNVTGSDDGILRIKADGTFEQIFRGETEDSGRIVIVNPQENLLRFTLEHHGFEGRDPRIEGLGYGFIDASGRERILTGGHAGGEFNGLGADRDPR